MPYNINHLANLNIVEVEFIDHISGSDLREATTKCIALQKEIGADKFLVHANGSEVLASFVEFYDLACCRIVWSCYFFTYRVNVFNYDFICFGSGIAI